MTKKKNTPERTKKTAYTRKTEAKLEEAKGKLAVVKAKIKGSVAGGQIEAAELLQKAEARADSQLAKVQRRLERLKAAGDDSWEDLKDGTESAWEDLSKSIKKIASRLSSDKKS
ncbi:MAG: hypothetical protein WBM76_11235 [Woeseiaceae bacterium]